VSSTYRWHVFGEGEEEDEEPVVLEVDARGLTLLPDLGTLEEPHRAWVRPEGVGWWALGGSFTVTLDPRRVPSEFASFADETGVIPYSVLATAAARTAVEFTKTAAVVKDVPRERIRRYAGTVVRYDLDLHN